MALPRSSAANNGDNILLDLTDIMWQFKVTFWTEIDTTLSKAKVTTSRTHNTCWKQASVFIGSCLKDMAHQCWRAVISFLRVKFIVFPARAARRGLNATKTNVLREKGLETKGTGNGLIKSF